MTPIFNKAQSGELFQGTDLDIVPQGEGKFGGSGRRVWNWAPAGCGRKKEQEERWETAKGSVNSFTLELVPITPAPFRGSLSIKQ